MSPTSSHTPLPAGGPNNVSWPAFPSPPGPSGSSSRFPSAPGYPRQSDSLASLISAYAGLTDHMFVRRGGNCGCLNDVACYNVVLELSLRLRKAADVLARSPSHSSCPSDCTLNTHISDLDMFAKNMLLDRDIPNYGSLSMPPGGGLNRGHGFGYATASGSPSTDENGHGWNGGDSESFMSWAPQRKNQ
ncbi:hypothetical protein GGX14DRAFT_625977 [Mycena pura]|uniref:Uncharacterized protein n=1 Tax=Mycena pura TaxID=153505 RepID=A0AAD6VFL6_9AGAR|nr:hypothetical protein GGX14DRAFT_625977 [Mycena pura]